jgi:hypothetical protein
LLAWGAANFSLLGAGNDLVWRAQLLAAPLSAAPAVVSVASGVVPLGGVSVTLPVNVTGVTNLGALTAILGYDSLVVTPVQCRINRSAFDLGLCNLGYDRDQDGRPDAIRFNATALYGVTVPPGASSPIVEVSWQTTGTATVGAVTQLTLTVVNFDDSAALPLAFTPQDGNLLIAAAPATATPPATATFASTPTPTQSPIATFIATPMGTATPTVMDMPTMTATSTPTTTVTSPDPNGASSTLHLPLISSP